MWNACTSIFKCVICLVCWFKKPPSRMVSFDHMLLKYLNIFQTNIITTVSQLWLISFLHGHVVLCVRVCALVTLTCWPWNKSASCVWYEKTLRKFWAFLELFLFEIKSFWELHATERDDLQACVLEGGVIIHNHTRFRSRLGRVISLQFITSRYGASRHAGLILIHHFPLLLLFHNHRSVPVLIRGYHLQTLVTLPWLPYTSFLPPLSPSLFFLSFPTPTFFPAFSHSSYICL